VPWRHACQLSELGPKYEDSNGSQQLLKSGLGKIDRASLGGGIGRDIPTSSHDL
jgi:hypothetical protein